MALGDMTNTATPPAGELTPAHEAVLCKNGKLNDIRRRTVFVEGLPLKIEEASVARWLADCGAIEHIGLDVNDGAARGQPSEAVVVFKDVSAAEAALALRREQVGAVDVQPAVRGDERRQVAKGAHGPLVRGEPGLAREDRRQHPRRVVQYGVAPPQQLSRRGSKGDRSSGERSRRSSGATKSPRGSVDDAPGRRGSHDGKPKPPAKPKHRRASVNPARRLSKANSTEKGPPPDPEPPRPTPATPPAATAFFPSTPANATPNFLARGKSFT